MRKAERLFQILTLLRSRRTVITAQSIAAELEVSERTIYRDIQALQLTGVPIEGEAGVGYRLQPGFTLPPLMFDQKELEALRLGVRMVEAWSGSELSKSATSALNKIEAILPERTHWQHTQSEHLIVPDFHRERVSQFSDEIHQSIASHNKLILNYEDEQKRQTQRTVWPLGMMFWGNAWTLVSWCELREDYRLFRLDRINSLDISEQTFSLRTGISLQDYINSQPCS